MRVLLHAPSGDPLEGELAGRGLDVVRQGLEAEALVTVTPPGRLASLDELEPEEWLATFAAAAKEPFFAAQPWLARGSGSWVAVTSILGVQPFPGGGAAGAASLALQTLVRVAALEGVRANAIAAGLADPPPEPLDRELALADTPGGRLATAADVAAAVAWLLSDEAAHVNGEVLRVDGGYTITRGSRPDPGKG
jgi:NAD(P)-dependent dehydrogenase (short-subunit alcohol dehydrogenase family)